MARAVSPLAFASVHTGARLGDGVTLNAGASVRHDAAVGVPARIASRAQKKSGGLSQGPDGAFRSTLNRSGSPL